MTPDGVVRLIPPAQPIDGEVSLPGSKSDTNRALVAAALADGPSRLIGVSPSDDSRLLVKGLRCLGIEVREECSDEWIVEGRGGVLDPYRGEIDLELAGTSYRFLLPLCAAARGGEIVLTGNDRMQERPIADLVEPLRSLGAEIEYVGSEGTPPLRIRGTELGAGHVKLSARISSQFLTALLLAGPCYGGEVVIEVTEAPTSLSYVEMTRATLARFGGGVEGEEDRWSVSGGTAHSAGEYRVDGDASGASYFWGLAAVSGGRVRVRNLRLDSSQGDLHFPELLAAMGCDVERGRGDGGEWIDVRGGRELRGIDAAMASLPDTAQTLAVVAAFAEGSTTIAGLHSLAHKETDRLAALQTELGRVGIECATTPESITVAGGTVGGGRIHTYGDHRMAMAFALLGARVEGIEIEDPSVVSKSFPAFWEEWARLGIGVE